MRLQRVHHSRNFYIYFSTLVLVLEMIRILLTSDINAAPESETGPGGDTDLEVVYQAADYSRTHKVLTICVLKGKEIGENVSGYDLYSILAKYFGKYGIPTKEFIHQSERSYSRVGYFIKGEIQGIFLLGNVLAASMPAVRKFASTYNDELLYRIKMGDLLLKMHSNDKFITGSSELLNEKVPSLAFSKNDRALTFMKESNIPVPTNATDEEMAKVLEHYVSAWKSLVSN